MDSGEEKQKSQEIRFAPDSSLIRVNSGPVTLITSSAIISGDQPTYTYVLDSLAGVLGEIDLPTEIPSPHDFADTIAKLVETEKRLPQPVALKIAEETQNDRITRERRDLAQLRFEEKISFTISAATALIGVLLLGYGLIDIIGGESSFLSLGAGTLVELIAVGIYKFQDNVAQRFERMSDKVRQTDRELLALLVTESIQNPDARDEARRLWIQAIISKQQTE